MVIIVIYKSSAKNDYLQKNNDEIDQMQIIGQNSTTTAQSRLSDSCPPPNYRASFRVEAD